MSAPLKQPISFTSPELNSTSASSDTSKVTREELIQRTLNANTQLLQSYKQDGPFVYELFACLVHSGGAYGGHYYAYIYDKHSETWFNFNDQFVSKADIVDLA
jgi:ubiquitin carboxyl-terminal hydrolase 47